MPDPPELHEQVDLALEHRRYVLEVHPRLMALEAKHSAETCVEVAAAAPVFRNHAFAVERLQAGAIALD